MLQQKSIRHDILLAAYKTGGVLQQLPPQKARAVFEHAEMLAAAGAVLDWHYSSEADANAGDTLTGGELRDTVSLFDAPEHVDCGTWHALGDYDSL